ncbi:clavesin-2-like isoform X4 [Varroa destructor]|uniref:CRAL-TRIO domain-containing protein n=1 Tax=Varroa destructor TaxID=109461 RepID=A0A7M7JLI9_VARDE|nr:clavesin-2-like isoform X4 [Varroa destructor]
MKGHATLPLLFPVTQQRGLCHGRRHAHRDPKKVFIARVGHWNADSGFTLKDTYVPDIFLLEQALDDDESQVRGLVAIVDMAGFSFWHMRQLSFSHIKVLVHTVQDAFPARFKAIHVVNQPGLYDYIYACIRPFLKPKIMKRIHLHGSDMTSLHEHIDPEILPEEYGGQAGPFNNDWICQQLYQRDEEFRKYSHYGFPRNEK